MLTKTQIERIYRKRRAKAMRMSGSSGTDEDNKRRVIRMTAAELRAIRHALGLSQAAMAERIGVHRVTLTRYETGVLNIPGPVARLCAFLAPRD